MYYCLVQKCDFEYYYSFFLDYHPDVAIECYPQHIPSTVKDHWRGLRFENAKFSKELMQQNTFYVPVSESSLKFVEIRYITLLFVKFYGNGINL